MDIEKLIEEAKRRYPTGTKLRNAQNGNKIYTINWENMPAYKYDSPLLYTNGAIGGLYLGADEEKGNHRILVFFEKENEWVTPQELPYLEPLIFN